MPARTPLGSRALTSLLGDAYVCPSCVCRAVQCSAQRLSTQRRHASVTIGQRKERGLAVQARVPAKIRARAGTQRRYAHGDSLASVTAINAPSTVPEAYRELYQKLLALQDTASSFVDLARLQLGIRSLERETPVLRVAFLGLGRNGPLAARKLARVLLSDALADTAAWEKEILDSVQDGRNLLLRYGEVDEPVQESPLVKTMNVPSPYLRRSNVEILIAGFNISQDQIDVKTLQDAILVPPLTTPNAAGGRVGFVRYPVHKAVVVAEGITGAVEYGSLPSDLVDGNLINAALSVPLRPLSGPKSAEQEASSNAVDIDLAAHALQLFRASKANGAEFSREWQTSRVSALGEWIAGTTMPESEGLEPAVRNLVSSVLSTTNNNITQAEELARATATASTIPSTKRQGLLSTIGDWSALSHRDLQLNLDSAFITSPIWNRTKWFRLFWRIDDVTVSASDVLRRSWLNESEQILAFVSGRIAEAGLATEEQLRSFTPKLLDDQSREHMVAHEFVMGGTENATTSAQLTPMPSMLAQMQRESGINAHFDPPWPQTIALSRVYMLQTLVPELHRKAQGLLLTTLSTIGGSAALSGWFYLATSGVGLYESGAILALGLVWSLRRLQKRWGLQRQGFASAVREDARRVIGEVEGLLRKLVEEGGKVDVRVEDVREWNDARRGVEEAQRALESIGRTA